MATTIVWLVVASGVLTAIIALGKGELCEDRGQVNDDGPRRNAAGKARNEPSVQRRHTNVE